MPVYRPLKVVLSIGKPPSPCLLCGSRHSATAQSCPKSAHAAIAQTLLSSSSRRHAPSRTPPRFAHPHSRPAIPFAPSFDLPRPNLRTLKMLALQSGGAPATSHGGAPRRSPGDVQDRTLPRMSVAARSDTVPVGSTRRVWAHQLHGCIAAVRLPNLGLHAQEEVGGISECLTRRRASSWAEHHAWFRGCIVEVAHEVA